MKQITCRAHRVSTLLRGKRPHPLSQEAETRERRSTAHSKVDPELLCASQSSSERIKQTYWPGKLCLWQLPVIHSICNPRVPFSAERTPEIIAACIRGADSYITAGGNRDATSVSGFEPETVSPVAPDLRSHSTLVGVPQWVVSPQQ